MIGVGLVLRAAEEASAVEEAAHAEDEQADEEGSTALQPEVRIFGYTRHGGQPATYFLGLPLHQMSHRRWIRRRRRRIRPPHNPTWGRLAWAALANSG